MTISIFDTFCVDSIVVAKQHVPFWFFSGMRYILNWVRIAREKSLFKMRRRIVLNFRNSEDQASENIDTTPLRRSTVAFPRLRLLHKDFKSVSHVFFTFFFYFCLYWPSDDVINISEIFDADNILISIAS